MFVPIMIVGLFIVFGIILLNGKGAFLIAGFNTMPKDEREKKYDSEELCKFMGKMMFVLGLSVLIWVLSESLGIHWLFTAGLILFFGTIIFILIYTNTGNRFRK